MTPNTQKKLLNIALISLCTLILLGMGLTVYLLRADRSVITLDLQPDKTQTVEFSELCLLPGEQSEFTLVLRSDYATQYLLTLAWEDCAPEHTLKEHVYVRVEKDGAVLREQLLAQAFTDDALTLSVDFDKDANNELKIIYYMPEAVGNEAQNAEADFKLLVTATNE